TTAEHLRRATGAPLSFEPLLQERNFGDLRGRTYSELGFDMFEPDYAPPNGETWPVFHERVDRAWARVQALAAESGGDPAAARPPPAAPPLDPRGRRTGARPPGERVPDDRRLAGAVARAPADLRGSPRRIGRRPARRLRRRLTVEVSTRPAPGRSLARRRRRWYGACRAADSRRNGARDASPGGCPT